MRVTMSTVRRSRKSSTDEIRSVLVCRVIRNSASMPIHGRTSMLTPIVPTPWSGPMRTARRSTEACA